MPAPPDVLEAAGLRPPWRLSVLKDIPGENASWLADGPGGERLVLRRYHPLATEPDLAYEHAVLRHLDRAGWTVPAPAGELIRAGGLWYCLTRYVPGAAVAPESAAQRTRRGRDLARLHAALHGLGGQLGQRPGWRAQHQGVTVHTELDWDACLAGLTAVSPRLGHWAAAAAARATSDLAAIGAAELPAEIVHGDFAEWNVHYTRRPALAGVIDFELTHLDSRPYELAIARTYRAPEAVAGYQAETAALGWPLTALEQAAIGPVYRAFRVDMAAWAMHCGLVTGTYDLAMIERQLARSGAAPPR
jgi:homoserine kinase type II